VCAAASLGTGQRLGSGVKAGDGAVAVAVAVAMVAPRAVGPHHALLVLQLSLGRRGAATPPAADPKPCGACAVRVTRVAMWWVNCDGVLCVCCVLWACALQEKGRDKARLMEKLQEGLEQANVENEALSKKLDAAKARNKVRTRVGWGWWCRCRCGCWRPATRGALSHTCSSTHVFLARLPSLVPSPTPPASAGTGGREREAEGAPEDPVRQGLHRRPAGGRTAGGSQPAAGTRVQAGRGSLSGRTGLGWWRWRRRRWQWRA
jgi:hypothetical protein